MLNVQIFIYYKEIVTFWFSFLKSDFLHLDRLRSALLSLSQSLSRSLSRSLVLRSRSLSRSLSRSRSRSLSRSLSRSRSFSRSRSRLSRSRSRSFSRSLRSRSNSCRSFSRLSFSSSSFCRAKHRRVQLMSRHIRSAAAVSLELSTDRVISRFWGVSQRNISYSA